MISQPHSENESSKKENNEKYNIKQRTNASYKHLNKNTHLRLQNKDQN